MNVADFDAWRERYEEMTYREMKDFYDAVEIDHPLQQAYDADAFGRLLDHAVASIGLVSVLEIGGWKGELAQKMLVKPNIAEWHNLEICENAVQKSIFSSSRYKPLIPDCFVWTARLPRADIFIASHFIEHIKWWELKVLISRLSREIQFIGLQAPIQETGMDWTEYHGTHILEVGWRDISAYLFANGFAEIEDLRDGDFRAFARMA